MKFYKVQLSDKRKRDAFYSKAVRGANGPVRYIKLNSVHPESCDVTCPAFEYEIRRGYIVEVTPDNASKSDAEYLFKKYGVTSEAWKVAFISKGLIKVEEPKVVETKKKVVAAEVVEVEEEVVEGEEEVVETPVRQPARLSSRRGQ